MARILTSRAKLIIDNCAHPEFKDQLYQYLHLVKQGHEPQSLSLGFAMHRHFIVNGDMRNIDWESWR